MIGLQDADAALLKISGLADNDTEGQPTAIQAWVEDIKRQTETLLLECDEIGHQLAVLRSMVTNFPSLIFMEGADRSRSRSRSILDKTP